MATIAQRSFSGGELSPSLHQRVDITKYVTGLRTCRNFQIMRHGGASNRSGSYFVGEIDDSDRKARLIPFVFNAEQSYVLEFSHETMRVIRNGAYVVRSTAGSYGTITAITKANPGVFTMAGNILAPGDHVYISGALGMTEINGRTYRVTTANPTTFTLETLDGTPLNTTSFGTYTGSAYFDSTYYLPIPYAEDDLPELQFIQSADVLTIVHQNYKPAKISRLGHDNWAISYYAFAPETSIDGVINWPTLAAGGAGTFLHRYKITGINRETGEESLPFSTSAGAINLITKFNPASVTTASNHLLNDGDTVYINGVSGMTEVNNREFVVDVFNATTYDLVGINSINFNAYVASGTDLGRKTAQGIYAANPTSAAPITMTFTGFAVHSADIKEFNIYKEKDGVFGYLGTVANQGVPIFKDVGLLPDTADQPPEARNPFEATGDWPATVAYIQQRLSFANTVNNPEKIWTSRTGKFTNFTTSIPSSDDQAITFEIVGRQVNAVQYLLDLGKLVVFTTGGEWVIGGENGIITPTSLNPRQTSYNGSSKGLPPIVIGNTALYVQARGSIIRDLGYSYESEGYTGNDLTTYSTHLFDKNLIKDWTFQQTPHSIVWAVRDDGTLLGLTYIREQEVLAWHRHDTDGIFENVCAIPEGNEDVLYAIVRRFVNGRWARCVERFATRHIRDIKDATFLDSYLSYDGRNKTVGRTVTLSNGSTWNNDELLTLTCSASIFKSTDVGNMVEIQIPEGGVIRFTIDSYTSGTVVIGRSHKTVPVSLRNVATELFTKAVDELSGLWHLEGKKVSVFGDGFVVANPNNPAYDERTVTGGKITLDKPYGVIHVGLPITADLETLNIDTVQGETLMNKQKLVQQVTMFVEDSRGVWVGPEEPKDGTTLGGLTEMKVRSDEGYDDPISLIDGTMEVNIHSHWNSNGRVFVRQTDPIPLSVLAISPTGLFPFRQ